MPDNWFSLRRFFDFSGRASRREYFICHLIGLVGLVVLFVVSVPFFPSREVGGSEQSSPIFGLLMALFLAGYFVMVVTFFAVAARRLHDQGKSGWYMFFGLIPLIGWIITLMWIFTPGDEGENEYGPDPRDGSLVRSQSYDGVFD